MHYSIQELEKIIAKNFEEISFDNDPVNLYRPINYILSIGGKRVRPILTLMATDLFDGDINKAVKAAMAIEIFHNFSLLHDDLMDKSDTRRGNPTVHKKWNNNIAILSGDAMLIESYKYIAQVPDSLLPEILNVFSNMAMDVCKGQQLDMDYENQENVSEAQYLEMIRLKTAVLIASALKIGAIMSGAKASDADLLYNYGINIGLAFQLKDDILDVYGNQDTFGKKIGEDIINNKKTFLLLKALETSNPEQRKELEKWIAKTEFDEVEKFEAVKKIYEELDIKTISESMVEKYYQSALECLSSIDVCDERKKELYLFAENLNKREK